jgi:hypothetical protein
MNRWTLTVATALVFGCGGDKAPPKQVDPVSSVSSAPVPSASAAPSATPSASASVAPPPAMKGTIHAFARAATSGTVDKVGDKDGNFKPDGTKDVVFDLDYEGTATAIFVMTTDKQGALTSELDADTIIGEQAIPKELAGILAAGKHTYGLAVYEGDKLNNGKDGALTPLAEGRHKLALHLSPKEFPKSAVMAIVMLSDGTLVKSAVLPAK